MLEIYKTAGNSYFMIALSVICFKIPIKLKFNTKSCKYCIFMEREFYSPTKYLKIKCVFFKHYLNKIPHSPIYSFQKMPRECFYRNKNIHK